MRGIGNRLLQAVKQHWPWMLVGLLCAWPALYNGFPLVYPDSGTYINSSFDLRPPADRAVGYGYIIHAVTWRATMWTVPFLQGLILAALVYRVFRTWVGAGKMPFFVTMGLLLAASSLPWFVAQLMPDIFAGALVLAITMALLPDWRPVDGWAAACVVVLAIASHNANFVIATGSIAVSAYLIWRSQGWRIALRRMAPAVAALVVAVTFLALNLAANGHGLRLSRSSNLFLTARLNEAGLLEPWLQERCAVAQDSICALKDNLPSGIDGILWDPRTDLIDRFGGWGRADSALAPTVAAYWRSPRRVLEFLGCGLADGGRLLVHMNLSDGLGPHAWDDAPCMALRWRLPGEVAAFQAARQQQRTLHVQVWDAIQFPLVLSGFVVWLFGTIVYWHKIRPFASWSIAVVGGILVNALVMGTFSGPVDRYNARVDWLWVMLGCLVVAMVMMRRNKANP